MPIVLTEINQFDATITVPVDGDVRNAASVQGPLQSHANRTRFLKTQLDNGQINVQVFASSAAMKTAPAPSNDQLCFIPGSGLYIYDVSSTQAEVPPYVYIPNSGPAAGRWRSFLAESLTYTGGALGAAVRLLPAVPNSLLTMVQTSLSAPGSYTVTPLGPFVDSGAISSALTLNVGDTVLVEVSTTLQNNTTNANAVGAQLAVLDPAAVTTALAGSKQQLAPGGLGIANVAGAAPCNLKYLFTALLAGAHQFKIQLQAPNVAGATVSIYAPYNFIVSLVRP